jgi:hypothetical protein
VPVAAVPLLAELRAAAAIAALSKGLAGIAVLAGCACPA